MGSGGSGVPHTLHADSGGIERWVTIPRTRQSAQWGPTVLVTRGRGSSMWGPTIAQKRRTIHLVASAGEESEQLQRVAVIQVNSFECVTSPSSHFEPNVASLVIRG